VRQIARKLCLVGLLAFLGACVVLYLFEHTPFPWGAGTLPGGMSDDYDRAMQWQIDVGMLIFAVGVSGTLSLLLGGVTWLISWLPKRARP